MKSKNFEYFHKDIKQLKIDVVNRIIFAIMFLGIAIWQSILYFSLKKSGYITQFQIILFWVVIVPSILLTWIMVYYALKDSKIIATIRETGKCASRVAILFSTDKSGFLKLYKAILTFITIGVSLLMVASVTYCILEITFYRTISYYMPLLFQLCISGFSSIYHIRDEILTQENVQEQRPLY